MEQQTEYIREVFCEKCEEWEQNGADEQRWHIRNFDFDLETEKFTCTNCNTEAKEEIFERSET